MRRWTPGRLQGLGYLLGVAAVGIIVVVALVRPRSGLVLLGLAVLLSITGGAVIWVAQKRGTTR